MLTPGLLCQLLPPHHVLLLVIHQLDRCRVERLLQLGEVDLCMSVDDVGSGCIDTPFHVASAAEKFCSAMV